MKAHDLAQFLLQYPDLEVLAWYNEHPDPVRGIVPVIRAAWDCFHPDGPHVIVLELDTSQQRRDAVEEWLDGERDTHELREDDAGE